MPVRLGTPVTRVGHRGRRPKLEMPAGAIAAARVIVAVPTTMIASGTIRFNPPLPNKQAAADALPLGLADKVFLRVEKPPWPAHSHLLGNPHSAMTASYRLSPFGWTIVEAFFGGDCAEALEDGDAAAFAIDELIALLGTDWRGRSTPLATTRWRREPWIGGGYARAKVGCADQREARAAPVNDRIFFPGEACSRHDFSTAHGAYGTGVAAAEAVLSRG